MTAIAGAFRLDGQPLAPNVISAMAAPVLHRGAGDPDIEVIGNAGLIQVGMPATSPIGSPAQIARSESGRRLAVFDGRLDDYDALCRELGLDPALTIHDADVLLAAVGRWGDSATSHLTGDYSFAVYDTVERTLLCARDPIGPRMFSYAVADGVLYFATEIKQLFAAPGVSTELDEEMLGLYLSGAARYGESTLYKHVKRLKGGFSLHARVGSGVSTSRFWDMRDNSLIVHSDLREYAGEFRDRFFRSVTDRLRGEGPAAILLSGGLDSGSVACVAGAADTGRELKAYYFRQSNPEFDEEPFAREICDTYGISLTTIDAYDLWALKQDSLAETRDEPFLVPFEHLNQEAVRVAAADGSRVVLTGEGGDEGFAAGYMLYLRDWLKGLRFRSIYRDLKNGTPQYRSMARRYLKQHLAPGFVRRLMSRYRTTIPQWVDHDFVRRTDLQRRLEATLGTSYLERDYFSGRGSHPFHILWDHRAASFGMEPGHPLWDLRIVEYLSLIPPDVRLAHGRPGKELMKAALADVLTPGLMTRQPYAAMTGLFARGWHEESKRFLANCENSELQRRKVIDASQVAGRYRNYLAGDESQAARLFWSLVVDDWLLHRYPNIQAAAATSVGASD